MLSKKIGGLRLWIADFGIANCKCEVEDIMSKPATDHKRNPAAGSDNPQSAI
jgi:hypothetical protein